MPRSTSEQIIRRLYEISTSPDLGFAEQVQRMLEVGRVRFDAEIGVLGRVEGDTYTLEHLRAPAGFSLAQGDVLPLDQTFARLPLEAGGPVGIPDLPGSDLADTPAFRRWGLGTYLGAPVRRDGEIYGSLSFSSRQVRPRPVTADELGILELMTAWLGTELSRRKREEDLRKAEESFRLGVEASPAAMVIVDQAGVISYLNREACRLFASAKADLIGTGIEALVPEGSRPGHRGLREGFMTAPAARPMGAGARLEARRLDGSVFPAEIALNPIETPYGNFILCTVLDLSERLAFERKILEQTRKLEEINRELAAQALSDPLTGLANRRGLLSQMETALRLARRAAQPTSVLMADLDHFKEYNDTLGHQAGDQALQAVGRILRETARRSDIVARFGGEEFVLVLPETGAAGAIDLAERIRTSVQDLSGLPAPITVSIGAATLVQMPPDEPVHALCERLIREADQALYRAKDGGRNRVVHIADVD